MSAEPPFQHGDIVRLRVNHSVRIRVLSCARRGPKMKGPYTVSGLYEAGPLAGAASWFKPRDLEYCVLDQLAQEADGGPRDHEG